jgi:hypothetical protein
MGIDLTNRDASVADVEDLKSDVLAAESSG